LKKSTFIYIFLLFCFARINAQNDCTDAIVVCGNTGFAGLTATGVGVQELNPFNVCSSEENNSIWLRISVDTAGTLAFVLIPESTDIEEDFDFWLFGPNVTCGGIGTSIRCSTTNPQLSGAGDNHTGMDDSATDTFEGPGPDGDNYVQSVAANAGDSFFLVIDRPVGFSNFSLQWTGTATFNQQPALPIVNVDLQQCDHDLVDDGFTTFDLTVDDAVIMGAQTGVAITYHISQNDAITGNNAIIDPVHFVNTVNPQPIFARITNNATGCFDQTEFSIEVTNSITIPNNNFTACDDGSDGNGTNGRTNFNLNDVTAVLFSGINIIGMDIKYYTSNFNAENNIGPLPTTFYNTTPNQQNIYVKVINPATGCAKIKEITLHVNPQPAIVNESLAQCDSGQNPDGISIFNLSDAAPLFTLNDANKSVAFFESGNPTPLASSYTNSSNPQILTAVITNLATGCTSQNTLTLTVNVLPAQVVTTPPLCDLPDVENGIRNFDLNDNDLVLTPPQTVQFYANENDALLEQHAIANSSSYANPTPYLSSVFVRVEDNNSCSFISKMDLIVNKLPQTIKTADGYFVCSDLPQQFVTIDAAITEGLPSDFTYIWQHDGMLLPQASYQIQVNEAGIYTVDITALGCTTTRPISVQNSNNAIIESIIVDDFTSEVHTIQVNLNSLSAGNYVFSLDNGNGPFQESNFFSNVAPGVHELYIKDLNACGIIGPIEIYVLGIPKFFTPNGDGYNDTWNIKGVDAKFNNSSIIYIFDRMGKLLTQITASGTGWDGIYNKKPLPAEDYWYHIVLQDGRSAKGHFSLKR
jgi:gliding motility-associated-like protein